MPQTCVIGHHSRVLPYLSAPYGNSHRRKLIYPKVWQRGTSVVYGFGEAHLHAFLPDGRDSDVLQWFKLCGSHLWSTRCTWSDHVQRMISVCGAVLRFAWAWVAYVEHGAVCARWWHVQVCTSWRVPCIVPYPQYGREGPVVRSLSGSFTFSHDTTLLPYY